MALSIHASVALVFLFASYGAADDGDDFSNNLFSDLAPILALFGERVTMQFLSQSMGWSDCIMLAMAPLGIITTIVSAIRVGGPLWLKAIVGRLRENLSAAEMELMSSTSPEACELWNGKDVVRCQGSPAIREFICVLPQGNHTNCESVRVMELEDLVPKIFEKSQSKVNGEIKDQNTSAPADGADGAPTSAPTSEQSTVNSFNQTNRDAIQTPSPKAGDELSCNQGSCIIIARNTKASAPNITLNRPENAGNVEQYNFAAFGILLQLGVVLFQGFITYYPALRFEKNDRPITRYALPLTATGTFLLALGMLTCAHVVDSSTDEAYYKVLDNRKVQLIWLQQAETVSDQIFRPVAICRQKTCKVITTSSRVFKDEHGSNAKTSVGTATPVGTAVEQAPIQPHCEFQDLENGKVQTNPSVDSSKRAQQTESRTIVTIYRKTILGTIICLLGFVVQFVGLRSMHWSASIAQLAAVFVMTVLRTVARRGFTDPLDSQDLKEGHQLDWFALTLSDFPSAFWCNPLTNESSSEGQTKQKEQNDKPIESWIVTEELPTKASIIPSRDSSQTEPDEPSSADSNQKLPYRQTANRRTAQGVLNLRKDLAWLSDWRGPAADEAISLAQAMEIALNTLFNVEEEPNKRRYFYWYLPVKYGAEDTSVKLCLSWEGKQKWKARADQIDAALSLWLYSTEKQQAKEDTTETEESRIRSDRWLREKGLRPRSKHRRLGLYSPKLAQDLRWWVPGEDFNILQSTGKREEYETNPSVQADPSKAVFYDWKPLSPAAGSELYPGDSKACNERSNEDSRSSHSSILAVESYDPREKSYAKDIFSAFLWAVAQLVELPIEGNSKLQKASGESSGRGSLKALKLQNAKLSKLAQDIQNTGLESLYDAYLSIVPPFSWCERLPEPDAVIELACKQAKDFEKSQRWKNASDVYAELLEVTTQFSKDRFIHKKAVTICLQYLEARRSNLEIRNFYDWGNFYDYPERLKTKFEREEADLRESLVNLSSTELERDLNGQDLPMRYPNIDQCNVMNIRGRTPLHHACEVGDWDKAREILEGMVNKDAEVSLQDYDGLSPIHLAALKGHTEVVGSLLKHRADTRLRDNYSRLPIHCSAMNGYVDIVKRLVADASARDNRGRTALHYAAWFGKTGVLESLVSDTNRADIETVDYDNATALHLAAEKGRDEIVKYLISKGVNTKAKCRLWNSTPLHLAAARGHQKVIIALVKQNPEALKIKNSNWKTPLEVAKHHGQVEIYKYLGDHGNSFIRRKW